MAKVSDSTPKNGTNYTNLVGDEELGLLLSRIHSAQIRTGNELETHIKNLIIYPIVTLETLYQKGICRETEVIIKPHKPKSGDAEGIIVDFAVIFHSRSKVALIELKSSAQFDTQKTPQIYNKLNQMAQYINHPGLGYQVNIAVCVFYASDSLSIYEGFKRCGFKQSEVITGIQFCELLGVHFEDVMNKVAEDQPENKNYILMAVERIRQGLPVTPEEYFAQKKRQEAEQLRFHWDGGRNGGI